MSKVLVTGGAGLIGSNLCQRLLVGGHHVTCFDNFSTSARENVDDLKMHPRFELVVGDVRAPIRTDADTIYNLACPASPRNYQRDPINTVETCVLGAINVLEAARRCGARVLQASTSEIYGEPDVSPQHETYRGSVSVTGPRACYDEGKRCAESLFYDYHRQYGVDVRVARIFNTYGPKMDPADGRVVSNLIVQALLGQPLTIYGDGEQTRSFCYVDDLVDGLMRLMTGCVPAEPVNLGNPHEVTVLALAETVGEIVGGPSRIRFEPLPQDDPTHRRPDIRRARESLDWQPLVPLSEGLRKTVAYFEARLASEGSGQFVPYAAAAE